MATLYEQRNLIRLLKRKPASHMIDLYFNTKPQTINELKHLVEGADWRWSEFTNIPELQSYLNPKPTFSLTTRERKVLKNMFATDNFFYFTDYVYCSKIYQYPTMTDFRKFAKESMILNKDPDHYFVEGLEFTQCNYENSDKINYKVYDVSFGFGS